MPLFFASPRLFYAPDICGGAPKAMEAPGKAGVTVLENQPLPDSQRPAADHTTAFVPTPAQNDEVKGCIFMGFDEALQGTNAAIGRKFSERQFTFVMRSLPAMIRSGLCTDTLFAEYVAQKSATMLTQNTVAVILNSLGSFVLQGQPISQSVEALKKWADNTSSLPAVTRRGIEVLVDFVATDPEIKVGDDLIELLVRFHLREPRAVLFHPAELDRLGSGLQHLSFGVMMKNAGHLVGIVEEWNDKLTMIDALGLPLARVPEDRCRSLVNQGNTDIAVNVKEELLFQSLFGFSIPLLGATKHFMGRIPYCFAGIPWEATTPFSAKNTMPLPPYMTAARVTALMTGREAVYPIPSTVCTKAENYLDAHWRGLKPGWREKKIVIINPYQLHGLKPQDHTEFFWASLVVSLIENLGAFTLVVQAPNPNSRESSSHDSFVEGLKRLINLETLSLGFPQLNVLREIYGLPNVIASLHVDTGTHHVAALNAESRAYYFAGREFNQSSRDVSLWRPPVESVRPIYVNGIYASRVGIMIADDLKRRQSGDDVRVWPHDLLLKAREIIKKSSPDERHGPALIENLVAIIAAVLSENPKNQLLYLEATHALAALQIHATRTGLGLEFARAVGKLAMADVLGHSPLGSLDPFSPLVEIFYGPLFTAMITELGFDPYTFWG